MLEEEEEELNDETIQARVDASLAKIYSVTSTWLKPKKTPSAPKKDFEKELEEIMRRPPRLGVGAELPEKQVKTGPGELKLKNKMLGNKREREETNICGPTDVKTPEDDEEDSRSRVIRKKPRSDPFASGKKKGKGLNIQTAVPPRTLAGSPLTLGTSPGKEKAVVPTKDVDFPGPSSSNTASACQPTPGDGDDDDKEEEQLIAKDVVKVHKSTPNQSPALCLHGPPTIRDDAVSSPKKKRKHRKKKKHHHGGVTAAVPSTSTS